MAPERESATSILTFLIADVRGYTRFTQAQGDEAAARLAAKFAAIAREGVEAHGGDVIELRGDEALAVFGSARQALRAAVALQETFVDEVEIDPTLPLRVGIGLDAGEAVPVEDGYRGGALNLAARLCSKAGPAQVLASQGLAHLARALGDVTLVEDGLMEMKGLAEPVRVFQALPAGAEPGSLAARLETVDGRPPAEPADLPPALDPAAPIVGRDREVRRLRWLWRTARRGGGTGVVIVGPSGIGKTRLAAEGAVTAAERGSAVAYASFADDPPAAREAVRAAAASDAAPTMIVLDDLESADADGLALAAELVRGAAGRRQLVVVAYDDERASAELIARARAFAGEDGTIRLGPLGPDDVRRIAALYLGSAVDALPASVLEAAAGVPRRVHEHVSEWAHAEATRRLGVLATRAAAGRSDLRSVEEVLAGSVVDLQVVREQARLFGAGPGRGAAATATAPYKGLSSFGPEDTAWFFGREALVAELIARLAGAPMLGVIGPSGSGKSSAVRAGLVPALRAGVLPGSDGWIVAIMRPGEHPLRELDRALWGALPKQLRDRLEGSEAPLRAARDHLGDGERLVLLVDQFEETYTLCADPAERQAFIAALVEAARDTRANEAVVLALRADFYGRCAEDPALAELLSSNQVLVGAMSADEYRRAVEQPALRAGLRVEPALVDELVGEVVGEPGALPLLSTALLELWEHRDGRTIRAGAHDATAGVRGAVARLAEDVFSRLDEEQRRIARAILLRLAGPGEGRSVVRRRVPRAEFDAERNPEVARVLAALVDGRLLTLDDGAVEVAHEALLREWPRFQGWLDEDREGRRLRLHLAESAREWADREHDPAELYRGARLSSALDWTTEHTLELNELEREFVAESSAASRRELDLRQRQNRRLRGLLAGAAVLLVLAIAAGVVALAQRSTARTSAQVALAGQLGSEAVSEPRLDRSMLLAREGLKLDDSTQTRGTLLATLLRSPSAVGTFAMPITARPLQLAVRPGGRELVVTDNQSELRFFDTRTRRELRAPMKGPSNVPAPAFSADGSRVLIPYIDPKPRMEVRDGDLASRPVTLAMDHQWLTKLTGQIEPIALSGDGRTAFLAYDLIVGGKDGPAFVDRWDATRPGPPRLVPLGSDGMLATGVTAAGRLVTMTGTEAVIWDIRSMKPLQRVPIHPDLSQGPIIGAIDPTGRRVAWCDGRGSITVVDLRSGAHQTASAAVPLQNAGFSPDGRTLAVTGASGTVLAWNLSEPEPQPLPGHGGRVTGIAFADASTLYTASLDGAIFEWDLRGAHRFGAPFTAGPPPAFSQSAPATQVPALAISPDSHRFAAASGAGTVGIFSTAGARRQAEIAIGRGRRALALDWSRGGLLAVADDGPPGRVALFDARGTSRPAGTLTGPKQAVRALAFSPDGRRLAVGTGDAPPPGAGKPSGELAVWDPVARRTTGRPLTLPVPVDAVAFSRDGARLAAAIDDGRVLVADPASGAVRRTLHPIGAPATAVAFGADGTLLTGTWSGIVQRWDPASGTQLGHPVLVAAAPVATLSISPAGDVFAAAGGSDGMLKLWDLRTFQQVGAAFPSAADTWGAARFTPDGASLVQLSDRGTGTVWPATAPAWARHACAVAGRDLTREEWSRLVGNRAYERTCAG